MLRSVMSGGVETNVIALGITSGVNVTELQSMASPPHNNTVILVPHFSRLATIKEPLLTETCSGNQVLFAVVINCLLDYFSIHL